MEREQICQTDLTVGGNMNKNMYIIILKVYIGSESGRWNFWKDGLKHLTLTELAECKSNRGKQMMPEYVQIVNRQ